MLSLKQGLINEVKHEGASTRRILERVKNEHFEYKPHDKSMSKVRLATHVADMTSWIPMILESDELDLASGKLKSYQAVDNADLLAIHDKNIVAATEALDKASDEEFAKMWTLRHGDHIIFSMPKAAAIRSMAMNHVVHHRGQLSVYLRLNDVPVPGMYGPSADER